MAETTISAYLLIHRLQSLGVRSAFGILGDYVLNFYKAPEESELAAINPCGEQGAGFADDPPLPGTAHRSSRLAVVSKQSSPLTFCQLYFTI